MFRKLCGYTALKNVVIATNMWDKVSSDTGEIWETELSENKFKPATGNGAQMVRHHNTTQSAHDIVRRIMGNHPIALRIQRELVDERRDLANTTAGKVINRELDEQIKRCRAELEEVRVEMAQALREKDEEMRRELETETRGLQKQMTEIAKDKEIMAVNYTAGKESMEGERTETGHDRKSAILTVPPQRKSNLSATDRTRQEQQVKQQDRLGGSGGARPHRNQDFPTPSHPLSSQTFSRSTL